MPRVSENSELPLVVWGAIVTKAKVGAILWRLKKWCYILRLFFLKIITRKGVAQNWRFFLFIRRGYI